MAYRRKFRGRPGRRSVRRSFKSRRRGSSRRRRRGSSMGRYRISRGGIRL